MKYLLLFGTILLICPQAVLAVEPLTEQSASAAEAQPVTFTPGASSGAYSRLLNQQSDLPEVFAVKGDDIKSTINGLKEAGYPLPRIVFFLKKSGRKAPEISIACLNTDHTGSDVYAALLQAGFPKGAADAAVPVMLRSSGQFFTFIKKRPTE